MSPTPKEIPNIARAIHRQICNFLRLAHRRYHLYCLLLPARRAEGDVQIGLRPEYVKDVIHSPQVLSRRLESVDAQNLVSGLISLRISVAPRTNLHDEAFLSNHLDLPPIIVFVWSCRREEECMRIVMLCQRGGDF